MVEDSVLSNAVAMHSMMSAPGVAALDSYEKAPRRSGNGSLSPQPAVPRLNPPEPAAARCGERHSWRRSARDHDFQLK